MDRTGVELVMGRADHRNALIISPTPLMPLSHRLLRALRATLLLTTPAAVDAQPTLGVKIARRIAQHHGGDLSFDSTPGEGTTAVVRLPRSL
jgi:hypothetical protein